MSRNRVHTAVVLPDIHFPYTDRSLTVVERFIGDIHPDEIVQLGDFMDLDCISSHNIGKLKNIEGKTLAADFAVGNAALDRWRRIAPKSKITILEGNHDERMLRYINANPQLSGSMEVPNLLNLRKRGIRWVPFWSTGENYEIGNAHFIHGLYTNEHHSKKHVSRWGTNVFYGHVHDVQCYSHVLKGEDKTIVGQSLGCLCSYDQSYMAGKPSNWQQAFGVFQFLPDGFFTYNVVRIFKARFVYGGQIYE